LEQKTKKRDNEMPDTESYYVPNKTYEIKVKIKDLDYTNDVVEVVLSSSLSTAYQVIEMIFLLDPNDVILEDIFGGEPIKLSITLLREQDFPGPNIDIDLLYLNSEFQLTEKSEMSEMQQKDRTYFRVTTVAREPFKSMSSVVNDVFIGSTLSNIVTELASSVNATVSYDSNGQNTSVIDQVVIPPTTFYKIIKEYDKADGDIFDGYLDQRFGLFSGTPGIFCQYDNKVYIKNLSDKLKKAQTFTVYQLASGMSSKLVEKVYEDALGGDVFYTYDLIDSAYAGNARFADLGSTINHIIKPKNTLTNMVSQDLKTVGQNYSLFYSQKNKNLFIDSYAERTKYYNEDTGNETETGIFESRFGRSLADLSTITLNLERNLPVLNLIDVGECVKFKPYTIEYQDFEGKYILWSSVVRFLKAGPDWATTAQINLSRTNKKN
jgi:hypothetical protein